MMSDLLNEIRDLKQEIDRLTKENDELRKELGNETSDNFNQYINSVYVDKQIEELEDEIQDLKNCIEMMEYDNRELTKTNLECIKLIGKYKQYGLDKDLAELEKLK